MTDSLRALLILLLFFALALPKGMSAADGNTPLERLTSPHLPNAIRVHPRVISGGLPEGEAAFAELRELGVRTLISVDGMLPDVALAKKFGLRYVHLPHGYDGIPASRIAELSAAIQSLPGPIYIHCHHGKHRSPTAAAAACVGAGLIGSADSLAVLRLAGTSPHYTGLYYDVAATRRLSSWQPSLISFPEQSSIRPWVTCMVQLEQALAALTKAVESPNATSTPIKYTATVPRNNPASLALLLREQFTELLRDEGNKHRPLPYVQLLQESETAAQRLEAYLGQEADPDTAVQHEEIQRLLSEVSSRCTACHQAYRDPAGSR